MFSKFLCLLGYHKWPKDRELWLQGATKWTYRKFCERCGALKTEVEPVPEWFHHYLFRKYMRG